MGADPLASPTETARRRPSLTTIGPLAALALAASSIGALLSDLYGGPSMAAFSRFVTVPALAALAALAVVRVPELNAVQERVKVGAVAGLVGTIGYDVIRVPFAVIGYRMFAPIDSYGLLVADASMSSPWTDTLGWLFHLSNGVTFGVMYAVVAAGRHWGWGVAWGLVLETVVVASPFRERYGLSGQTVSIALAYGAHVAYGYPLGRMVQRFRTTRATLSSLGHFPTTCVIGGAVIGLILWHQPWDQSDTRRQAGRLAAELDSPVAVVTSDRFTPEWIRVEKGGCLIVDNRSEQRYQTPFGEVDPDARNELCFGEAGVERVTLGGGAYSGGFVFVED